MHSGKVENILVSFTKLHLSELIYLPEIKPIFNLDPPLCVNIESNHFLKQPFLLCLVFMCFSQRIPELIFSKGHSNNFTSSVQIITILISYHDFGRYEVVSFTRQPLHLSLLLPVYIVNEASFIKGATGGLQVSA